jgi:hypothetical protein
VPHSAQVQQHDDLLSGQSRNLAQRWTKPPTTADAFSAIAGRCFGLVSRQDSQAGRSQPDDPGRARQGARAAPVRAVSVRDWQAARQALDDLMRKLLVVHRLLEAEERLAKRQHGAEPE